MMIAKNLWSKKWMLRSILKTIYFNFHYLPFKQACRLPIILYKPKLLAMSGDLKIESDTIKTGMIVLGKNNVSIYPNNGITFENHGGTIVFYGSCFIGNNSAISIGKGAEIKIGEKFSASTTLHLVSYNFIKFSDNVLIGWECTFMDTDFHCMTKVESDKKTKGYGSISIGKFNWFGCKCLILKNTETPDYCTISAASILNKKYNVSKYSIIGPSSTIEVKKIGLYRNPDNDKIIY